MLARDDPWLWLVEVSVRVLLGSSTTPLYYSPVVDAVLGLHPDQGARPKGASRCASELFLAPRARAARSPSGDGRGVLFRPSGRVHRRSVRRAL